MPVSDIPVNGDNVAGPVGPPSASGFDAVGPSIPGAEIKGDIIALIGTVQPADIAGERCLYRPQDTVVQLRLKGPALPPGKPDTTAMKLRNSRIVVGKITLNQRLKTAAKPPASTRKERPKA